MSNKHKRHGKYKKHSRHKEYKSSWQRFKEYMAKETGSGMRAYPNWLWWLFLIVIVVTLIFTLLK